MNSYLYSVEQNLKEANQMLIMLQFNLATEYEHLKQFKHCKREFEDCYKQLKKHYDDQNELHKKMMKTVPVSISKYQKYLAWFRPNSSFSNMSLSKGKFVHSLISMKTVDLHPGHLLETLVKVTSASDIN